MFKFIYSSSEVSKPRAFFYQYTDNRFRIVYLKNAKCSGFEEIKQKNINNIRKIDSDEVDRISISRTKRNIKEICLCNSFTHFATLTVNSKYCDRFSLTACQDKLKYIIKERIRRKNKDFAYIFITEKHKNGAFHFHGLIKNLDDFYINNNGYLSHKAFDEIGFNSFLPIDTDKLHFSYERVCNYILKYISKDCIKNENNQIYISSRGLKKALKYEIEPTTFDEWSFENDFCFIKDIDLLSDNLSLKDYYILTHLKD